MRILITGLSGFLGQKLLSKLPADWEVVALSRSTLAAPPVVTQIKMDLTDADAYRSLPSQIDAVLSLAQSRAYSVFPGQTGDVYDVNVTASVRLADYAARAGAKSFTFFSTGSVYEPYTKPLRETDMELAPRSLNGVSKLAAERALSLYRDIFPVCCLRPFFPFGPHQTRSIVPTLFERINTGTAVQLDGKDGLTFSPVYVDDLINITVRAIEDHWRGAVNVAGLQTVTVRELSEAIARALGVEPVFSQSSSSALSLLPETDHLYSLYSPASMTNFDDALSQTIASFRNRKAPSI